MGLERAYLDFIEPQLASIDQMRRRLRICELGNQHLRPSVEESRWLTTGKAYWQAKFGYDHVSIDWNGRDGAIPLDLGRHMFHGSGLLWKSFDAVINSGVLEHVEPQAVGWQNVHLLTSDCGIMIHLLPATGSWPKHDGLTWYQPSCAQALADAFGYGVEASETISARGEGYALHAVVLRQTPASRLLSVSEIDAILAAHTTDRHGRTRA